MYLGKYRKILWMKEGDGEGGGGGGGEEEVPTLRELLPEDMRDAPAFKDIADVPGLAKQFTDLQAHMGNTIRLPGPDASDDDWTAFNAKVMEKSTNLITKPNLDDRENLDPFLQALGKPEKHEGYDTPEIDLKGVEINMEPIEKFKEVAHKLDLTQKQFKDLVTYQTLQNRDQLVAIQDAKDADTAKLAKEWGPAYDQRVEVVKQVAKLTKAPQQLLNTLENGSASYEAMMWLYDIASSLKGEPAELLDSDANDNKRLIDAKEARERQQEMRANLKHPIHNPKDPSHKAAMQKFMALTDIIAKATE